MNGRHFAALLGMLAAGFALLVVSSPYRMQRIFGFMDPWSDPFGKGYQLSHALIAFGRGEWLGVGLGASVEKLHYLPEAHTDFLLAVIAEELGLRRRRAGDRALSSGSWRAPSPSGGRPRCTSAISPRSPRRASASGSASRRSSTWA